MGFNFKSIFLVDESPEPTKLQAVNMPKVGDKIDNLEMPKLEIQHSLEDNAPVVQASISDPQIEKMFEDVLEKINKPGYDFMEYYEVLNGINDKSQYVLAFKMASRFDGNLTKERLVADANHYVDQINQITADFKTQSHDKLRKLTVDLVTAEKIFDAKIAEKQQDVDIAKKNLALAEEQLLHASNAPSPRTELGKSTKDVNDKLTKVMFYSSKIIQSFNQVKQNINQFL